MARPRVLTDDERLARRRKAVQKSNRIQGQKRSAARQAETPIEREIRLRKQRLYLNAWRGRQRGEVVIHEEGVGVDSGYQSPPRGFACDPSVWQPLVSAFFWGAT